SVLKRRSSESRSPLGESARRACWRWRPAHCEFSGPERFRYKRVKFATRARQTARQAHAVPRIESLRLHDSFESIQPFYAENGRCRTSSDQAVATDSWSDRLHRDRSHTFHAAVRVQDDSGKLGWCEDPVWRLSRQH